MRQPKLRQTIRDEIVDLSGDRLEVTLFASSNVLAFNGQSRDADEGQQHYFAFTFNQVEEIKALRDTLTTFIERAEFDRGQKGV